MKKIHAQYTLYLKNSDCIKQTLEILKSHGFKANPIEGTPPTITCEIEKSKCIDILHLDDIIINLTDMNEYFPVYEYKDNWKKVFPVLISSFITGLTVFGAVLSIPNLSLQQASIIASIPTGVTFLTQLLYKFFPEDTL